MRAELPLPPPLSSPSRLPPPPFFFFFLSRHPTYSCACCVSIHPFVRPLARPSARASERVWHRRTHTRTPIVSPFACRCGAGVYTTDGGRVGTLYPVTRVPAHLYQSLFPTVSPSSRSVNIRELIRRSPRYPVIIPRHRWIARPCLLLGPVVVNFVFVN